MRELQDFSALPILADALQEVDCDNVPLLNRLRDGPTVYDHNIRLVAYIMSDETRAALKWFDDFIEEYGLGYYKLSYGRSRWEWSLDEWRERSWWPNTDYDKGFRETIQNAFDCDGEYLTFVGNAADSAQDTDKQEFWDNFEVLTGTKVSAYARGASFSCSC
jgi:hypothetical protein